MTYKSLHILQTVIAMWFCIGPFALNQALLLVNFNGSNYEYISGYIHVLRVPSIDSI